MNIPLSNNIFFKYSAFAILVLMTTMQMRYLNGIGGKLFYILFFLYGVSFLALGFFTKNLRPFANKMALPFIFLMILTIFYLLLFDLSSKGLFYTFGRLILYSIILYSLYYYEEYYQGKFFYHMQYFFVIVLLLSILLPNFDSGRFTGIFYNSNSLGYFSAIGFGLILFVNNLRFRKTILVLLVIMVLISGSRTALAALILAFIFNVGFDIRKILLLIILFISTLGINLYIEKTYDIHTGIGRIVSSSEKKDLLSGRDQEFQSGINTIKLKLIEGNGLDKYAYISKEAVVGFVPENFAYNPHNSYIALFIQYGVLFGTFILFLVFYFTLKIIRSSYVHKLVKFFLIASLLAASTESFMFSVSGYEGFLLWFFMIMGLQQIYSGVNRSGI